MDDEDPWVEKWADIPGFSRYEISNQGRVRTKKTGKIRTGSMNHDAGCLRLGIVRDDMRNVTFYIHRLVAQAFLPDWDETFNVGFRDGDHEKCEAWNLVMLKTSYGIRKM